MREMPNIFTYAKKELSQDAVICWMLECAKSKNIFPQAKEIGKSFVKFLLEGIDGVHVDSAVQIIVHKIEQQIHGIDILTVLIVGKKAYPVIIEDKVDTFLREYQVKDYCKRVLEWMKIEKSNKWLEEINSEHDDIERIEWGTLQYVLFKTGYVSKKEMLEWETQISTVEGDVDFQFIMLYPDKKEYELKPTDKYCLKYFKSFIDGVSNKKDLPEILSMYIEHLNNLFSERKKISELSFEQAICPDQKEDAYNSKIILDKIIDNIGLKEEEYEIGGSRGVSYICIPLYRSERNKKNIEFNLRIEWSSATKYSQYGCYTVAFQRYCGKGIVNSVQDKEFDEKVGKVLLNVWGGKVKCTEITKTFKENSKANTYIKKALIDFLKKDKKDKLELDVNSLKEEIEKELSLE